MHHIKQQTRYVWVFVDCIGRKSQNFRNFSTGYALVVVLTTIKNNDYLTEKIRENPGPNDFNTTLQHFTHSERFKYDCEISIQ